MITECGKREPCLVIDHTRPDPKYATEIPRKANKAFRDLMSACSISDREGDAHHEPAALAGLRDDTAAVGARDGTGDREAEAHALVAAGPLRTQPPEGLEEIVTS